MTWDDAFEQARYLPVNGDDLPTCRTHPQHAVLENSDGSWRCTSTGHEVQAADRIGKKLRELETPA